MYKLYKKARQNGNSSCYHSSQQVSFFGCKSGIIPEMLIRTTPAIQSEPYVWHIDIETALAEMDRPASTLVIDLKPNNKKPNLSLYEVRDVWGYSSSGWTPILMRLDGLFVDADPTGFNR